jgi:hypothetical protein
MIKGVRKRKEIMSTEINELTFSELCERIKVDYGDKLPNSAYDSPESLIIAMKALPKDKPNFQYATGYNFYGNVLKSLVIEAAINYSSDRFTLRQLCEFRDLPLFKVQVMISKWNHRGYPYFTKLKKRNSNHENVYKLRKYAVTSYIAYKRRLSCNFDMNLHRAVPKRMALYVNINRYGKEMGLQMSDLPDVKKRLGIE